MSAYAPNTSARQAALTRAHFDALVAPMLSQTDAACAAALADSIAAAVTAP